MGTNVCKRATVDETFRANLRTVRESQGVSLRELSARLAASDTPLLASALSKIETGDRRVALGEAVALCDVLDVPIEVMTRGAIKVTVTYG